MALEKFTPIRFSAGQVIFRENAPCLVLYVIKSGQIEITRASPDKTQIPLGIVGSGEYLGELALASDSAVHTATATALTDVDAIQLSIESVSEQLKQAPAWLIALTKGLGQKLRHANDLIRRNGLIDPALSTSITAIEDNDRRSKEEK